MQVHKHQLTSVPLNKPLCGAEAVAWPERVLARDRRSFGKHGRWL
ncbi:MAG TPA: hypothetical protein VFG04_14590 [Planctomycetaceae bacterium]|nr:hypothetical protein [Planctomycetaceae bacterium]